MQMCDVKAKEVIFREGDAGDAAYIVASGAVEILKHADHGEVQLAVMEAGAVFGEMALFEPKNTRSATARALTDAQLEVIGEMAFMEMMGGCPQQLQYIMNSVLARLRDTSQRLAAKERATVILDQTMDRITLKPNGDGLAASLAEPIVVKVANLPYSIGGYPKQEEKPHHNDLDLPSDGPPLVISQRHVKIERHDDGVFVVDQGSRFCTIVNGKVIGRGKVSNKAPLQLGENKITLGDYTSPYKLLLICE